MRHPHETPELRVSLSGLAALGWSTYHPIRQASELTRSKSRTLNSELSCAVTRIQR
jgi:hypothetical protein